MPGPSTHQLTDAPHGISTPLFTDEDTEAQRSQGQGQCPQLGPKLTSPRPTPTPLHSVASALSKRGLLSWDSDGNPALSCPTPELPASVLEPTASNLSKGSWARLHRRVHCQVQSFCPPCGTPPTPAEPPSFINGPLTSQESLLVKQEANPITQRCTARRQLTSAFKGGLGDPPENQGGEPPVLTCTRGHPSRISFPFPGIYSGVLCMSAGP